MSLLNWARKEIEIAKKNNNDEYFGMCCDSALKAYETMLNDDHSGCSWYTTLNILNTLCKNEPLSPITDEDFVVNEDTILCSPEYLAEHGLKSSIQCPRMSSLFRNEYLDGQVEYHDTNRWIAYSSDSDCGFHSSLVAHFMDKLYPITMPYTPEEHKVRITECLTDKKNGDLDTVGIHYVTFADGTTVNIRKYFKYDEGIDSDWVEICHNEYRARYNRKIKHD